MKTPTYSPRGKRIGDRILNHLECCGQPYLTPSQLFKRLKLDDSKKEEFLDEASRLLTEGKIREYNSHLGWNSQLFFVRH